MGGAPKGLLAAPDGTGPLVARTAGLARALGCTVVLVGARPEYTALGIPMIEDAMLDRGPLGGLVALLEAAGDHVAIALACDLPRVERAVLAALIDAPQGAPIVAPRRDERWEPLFARYDPPRVLPSARARLANDELALQGLLDAVGCAALALGEHDARSLSDWDTLIDVALARVYRFEDAGAPLDLVPLAGRRALDRVGRKVSLEAWRRMSLDARAAIVCAGAAERVDPAAVNAALTTVESVPIDAAPEPDARAAPGGLVIDPERWAELRALDRWVLASLLMRGRSETLRAALVELGLSRNA
jgi:molybdopterin-guanine dinucleotide biosynthesis protein A